MRLLVWARGLVLGTKSFFQWNQEVFSSPSKHSCRRESRIRRAEFIPAPPKREPSSLLPFWPLIQENLVTLVKINHCRPGLCLDEKHAVCYMEAFAVYVWFLGQRRLIFTLSRLTERVSLKIFGCCHIFTTCVIVEMIKNNNTTGNLSLNFSQLLF